MDRFVKPKHKDLIVRFPGNKAILPVDGAWVPWTGKDGRYWRRRFIDDSITKCNPPTKKIIKPLEEPKHIYKKEKGHK